MGFLKLEFNLQIAKLLLDYTILWGSVNVFDDGSIGSCLRCEDPKICLSQGGEI